jgi:hypothetical protein
MPHRTSRHSRTGHSRTGHSRTATPEPATPEPALPRRAWARQQRRGTSCGTPEPTPVTGARLGLTLTAEQGESGIAWLLAPAWFFRLDDGTELPVLALAPSALAPVTPEPVDPATGVGSEPGSGGAVEPGTGGGAEPGSSAGASVGSVDPGLSPEPAPSS